MSILKGLHESDLKNKVTIEINCCNRCYNFDNYYGSYRETCLELKQKIKEDDGYYPIPDNCPFLKS